MKVLFAVHDEKVSLSIVKKYQREYKEIISYKNVYYFNAILKELQRDKTYDRVVIDEELEEFTSTSYEEKDKFIFNKLDNITDEASNSKGKEIPIILICSERRTKSEEILIKMFGIGIYNAIIGNDRSTDEVCRLINQPRSKKEAKMYYKIYAKDVDYDPEKEDDVSEEEMQHILGYFKRLGKNETKYVEAFKKITTQYNDKQMRVIMTILPVNVKSVLEENSPEYQKLIASFGGKIVRRNNYNYEQKPTSEKLLEVGGNYNNKQIVVPSSINKNIKKITIRKPMVSEEKKLEKELSNKDQLKQKNQTTDMANEPIKKRRGRPPKNPLRDEQMEEFPGFDDFEEEKSQYDRIDDSLLNYKKFDDEFNQLPGLDDDDFEELSPIENEEKDSVLPGVYDDEYDDEYDKEFDDEYDDFDDGLELVKTDKENEFQDVSLSELDDEDEEFSAPKKVITTSETPYTSADSRKKEMRRYNQEYDDYDYTNYNNLLTGDKKIITFVGTSKNGTSFVINNIAQILSESGINTAILDATQNRNSYYIYNNNDDALRDDAANSISNLISGNPKGMKVSDNLSVYVKIPGQDDYQMDNAGPILETLAKNYSVVLIDCDFDTPLKYFENAQEIFLVQSMDVLTIQPLTAFLKELKNKGILEQNKIRIIVNKALRLRKIDTRKIVGGMSNYNNPEMSIMTELFDRNLVVPIEIPFDSDVYAKYLEGIADCKIEVGKYPKEFQTVLKSLSSVIYPLLPARKSKERPQKGYQYSNVNTNVFSNSVNNTLNNMKRNY